MKMTLISKVTSYLIDNSEALAEEVVDGVLESMRLEIPEWERKQAISMYEKLINFLGNSLFCTEKSVPDELVTWSKANAEREAFAGGDISEIIVRYPPTRIIFTELLTNIALTHQLSLEQLAFIIKRINSILDISINETIFAFERRRDEIIKETEKEMAELSAPVVPLLDDVAVIPLIGSIDSYRATYILENVIPKIADLDLTCLIVDFSGILFIDVAIATYLLQIEKMLRLLGVNTIITGIRPELAQTVIQGGIDMSSVLAFATVQQALKSINK